MPEPVLVGIDIDSAIIAAFVRPQCLIIDCLSCKILTEFFINDDLLLAGAILDGSGQRLFIDPLGAQEVRCFETRHGRTAWAWRSSTTVSSILLDVQGDHLVVGTDDNRLCFLEPATGRLRRQLNNVIRCWMIGKDEFIIINSDRSTNLIVSGARHKIELSICEEAAFEYNVFGNRDSILVCRIGYPIVCYDKRGLHERWRSDLEAGWRVMEATWSIEHNIWRAFVAAPEDSCGSMIEISSLNGRNTSIIMKHPYGKERIFAHIIDRGRRCFVAPNFVFDIDESTWHELQFW